MDVPAGLTVSVDNNTKIDISGADKQLLGQFAAEVRAKRPPEPFKGKGVKYADEYIVRKEGKKK
jgi:large subunit ribosomal protein L6